MFKKTTNLIKIVILVVLWMIILFIILMRLFRHPFPAEVDHKKEAKIGLEEFVKEQNDKWGLVWETIPEIGDVGPIESNETEAKAVSQPVVKNPKKSIEEIKKTNVLCDEKCLFFSNRVVADDIFVNDDPVGTYEDEPVYRITGMQVVFSRDFIPVDTQKRYSLSTEILSEGDYPSDAYVGLAMYDENKKPITAEATCRTTDKVLIKSFMDNAIICQKQPKDWSGIEEYAGRRSLGFYYDGNIDQPADFVFEYYNDYYSRDIQEGAYQKVEGGQILLNAPLPEDVQRKIVSGKTVVLNHHGGSTYLYIGAGRTTIPLKSWSIMESGIISGEGFNNQKGVFRPKTKFVRIVIIGNYYSARFERNPSDNAKQYIKNVIFKEAESATPN
jgi:hypothetical protein